MKKLVLAIAAAAALSSTAFAQTNTSNAELVITGEITNASCGMKIKPINFQSKSIREFEDAEKTGWETSNIEFSKCQLDGTQPGGNGLEVDSIDVTVHSGTAADTAGLYWANSGTAANVGVELEIDGKSIKPAGSVLQDLPLASENKNVGIRARLVKTGTVTAGDVNTSVSITADYK